MKHEWHLALGTSLFLGTVAVIYFAWSGEYSGSVLLLFGGCAYALMFFYIMLQWLRRKRLPRAEDRVDANPEDGAGEIGFFPANSMWPAAMGVGAVAMAIGLAFGKWFWVIGGILLFGAIIGFAVEAESH